MEDVRVICDQKKDRLKKYGFVLFKKAESLQAVTRLGLRHKITPEIEIECKQTLLRDELKEKQHEENQSRINLKSFEEKKQLKKDKKRLKRFKSKVERLKELGQDTRELELLLLKDEAEYRARKCLLKNEDAESSCSTTQVTPVKENKPGETFQKTNFKTLSNIEEENSNSSHSRKPTSVMRYQEANNFFPYVQTNENLNNYHAKGVFYHQYHNDNQNQIITEQLCNPKVGSAKTHHSSNQGEDIDQKILNSEEKQKSREVKEIPDYLPSLTSERSQDFLVLKNNISGGSMGQPLDGFGLHREQVMSTKSEINNRDLKFGSLMFQNQEERSLKSDLDARTRLKLDNSHLTKPYFEKYSSVFEQILNNPDEEEEDENEIQNSSPVKIALKDIEGLENILEDIEETSNQSKQSKSSSQRQDHDQDRRYEGVKVNPDFYQMQGRPNMSMPSSNPHHFYPPGMHPQYQRAMPVQGYIPGYAKPPMPQYPPYPHHPYPPQNAPQSQQMYQNMPGPQIDQTSTKKQVPLPQRSRMNGVSKLGGGKDIFSVVSKAKPKPQ